MIAKLFYRLFLKITGWKYTVNPNIPEEALNRCILLAAPHTSNWDQPYTVAVMSLLEIPYKYTIKHEWTKNFFVGWLIKATGGLGVDRRPKEAGQERLSMVEAMANLFKEHEKLAMIVPPEGTRSLRTEWKSGFYRTAVLAGVPICFGYLDYKNKVAGIGGYIYPTGNMDEDMPKIMEFYQNIQGKFPENFSLDLRYLPKSDKE